MKKKVFYVTFLLIFIMCVYCQKNEFDWGDLPYFGYVSEEMWNSLISKRNDEILRITTDCDGKNISIVYLADEPEYVKNVKYGKKRVVLLQHISNRFIKALSFIMTDEIRENIFYSTPYSFGIQGYNNKKNNCLITVTNYDNNVTYTELGDYHISTGAYEWPAPDFETIKPFYFWDEYEKKIICVDIYMDEIKPIHNIRVTNPLFYYGGGDDSTNRALFICSTDPTTNTPIPNTTYELKSGKATKVVE